jgi:hypothetical protein
MIEPIWRAELVELIDRAISIAQELRVIPNSSEPNTAMLETTLGVLVGLRQKNIDCHLPPPNGRTTLGLARGVTDWIAELDSTLLRAVGSIERCYLSVPPEDPRFPALPDLTLVSIHADGSTTPPVPDGQAIITIQDKEIFHIGVWRRGDFGGHKESPVNEAALIQEALKRVQRRAPGFLNEDASTSLICPAEITDRMVWPEDKWPKE